MKGAPDGAYVSGLHIDGARWDAIDGVLAESTKDLYPPMPVLHVTAMRNTEAARQWGSCPVAAWQRTRRQCTSTPRALICTWCSWCTCHPSARLLTGFCVVWRCCATHFSELKCMTMS